MANVEAARLLLAKARQDEYVLEQVRQLRVWVEAQVAAAEQPGHG